MAIKKTGLIATEGHNSYEQAYENGKIGYIHPNGIFRAGYFKK